MPYQVDWLIPDHVIFQRISERLLVSEYWEGVKAVNLLMDSSPQPEIHVLVNTWDLEYSEATIDQLKQTAPYIHNRLGLVLLVLPSSPLVAPIVQMVSTLMLFFVRIPLKIFEDEAAARAYLAEQRPHLAPFLATDGT